MTTRRFGTTRSGALTTGTRCSARSKSDRRKMAIHPGQCLTAQSSQATISSFRPHYIYSKSSASVLGDSMYKTCTY
ncbi:unnamed protein product, partial [Nesidiocoris tenuis]